MTYGSDDVTVSSSIVADNSAPSGPDLGDEQDPAIDTGDGAFIAGFSLVESAAIVAANVRFGRGRPERRGADYRVWSVD
ncbi:MAG: hypothetical protein ACRDK9_00625 [Solirubrobacterales bacterium]